MVLVVPVREGGRPVLREPEAEDPSSAAAAVDVAVDVTILSFRRSSSRHRAAGCMRGAALGTTRQRYSARACQVDPVEPPSALEV